MIGRNGRPNGSSGSTPAALMMAWMGLSTHVKAVERVQRRLRRVTAALDAASISYAVAGGNAVAAWIGRLDAGATRATNDVDVLVRRADASFIIATLASLGFSRAGTD